MPTLAKEVLEDWRCISLKRLSRVPGRGARSSPELVTQMVLTRPLTAYTDEDGGNACSIAPGFAIRHIAPPACLHFEEYCVAATHMAVAGRQARISSISFATSGQMAPSLFGSDSRDQRKAQTSTQQARQPSAPTSSSHTPEGRGHRTVSDHLTRHHGGGAAKEQTA